jgi:serine/threonine protein kinase
VVDHELIEFCSPPDPEKDKGNLSVVFCWHSRLHRKVCVKIINATVAKKVAEFENEVYINKFIAPSGRTVRMLYEKHSCEGMLPHLLGSKEYLQSYHYMVFELCENATLIDLLIKAHERKAKLEKSLAHFLASDCIKALHHLHEVDNIGHGDVKADNLMLMGTGEVGIFDFGHSTDIPDSRCNKLHGTLSYNPPEIHLGEKHSVRKSDIFQLGVTLLTILIQNYPFGKGGSCRTNANY